MFKNITYLKWLEIRKCRTSLVVQKRLFYDVRSKSDTIFAQSSAIHPIKGSPIGVIRVSGKLTEQIIKALTNFRPLRYKQELNKDEKTSIRLSKIKGIINPRTAVVTKFFSPSDEELIDIGMTLWFPKPSSYTGEDVCEFNLHGSQAIMSKMLETLGTFPGLRPAEAGEFTFRAVENGKMTLLQAESLPDLIGSQTDNQRKLALRGLDGSTLSKYELWTENLITILAHLEASIDFGEDELLGEKEVVESCIKKIDQLSQDISKFVESASKSRDVIQSGIRVVILGKPNAGKSTFMNLLCNKQKSIVSDLSGTTRDVVEHSFELGGHSVIISDTAGLKSFKTSSNSTTQSVKRDSEETLLDQHDDIEKEGIRRAFEVASNADFILYLIDGSKIDLYNEKHWSNIVLEVENLMDQIKSEIDDKRRFTRIHLVINKIDLNENLSYSSTVNERIRDLGVEMSLISCKTEKNFSNFVNQLTKHFNRLASGGLNELSLLKLEHVNERHLSLLKATERHLRLASKLNLSTIDKMSQHVRESVDYLSRIVGTVTNDQVVDAVFRDFCIGK